MKYSTNFIEYPAEMPSNIMKEFHKETIWALRWDLTTESRLLTFVCLN